MLKYFFHIGFCLLVFVKIQGQEVLQTKEQINGFKSISQERIYVHYNTSFLLTGEYLFYKLYCLEKAQPVLSDISKIAYVELVGKDGLPIFRHKLRLQEGQAYGDFFIPTSVPSGSYKLLAYTQWMRNGFLSQFYQSDITIINPYQSNQSGIQVVNLKKPVVDSIVSPVVVNNTNNIGPIQMQLKGTSFNKRSKVSIALKGKDNATNARGDFSVSVRKKVNLKGIAPQSSDSFLKLNTTNDVIDEKSKGSKVYLPELRGELFCGKVEAKNDNYSVSNLKLAVSIPGEDFYFNAIATNTFGDFCFNVNKAYSESQMFFSVLSDNSEAYKVTLKTPPQLAYSKLNFKEVKVPISLRNEILERSIHNQIEHSFFKFKPDSLLSKETKNMFDNKEKRVYLLDDFTRFKTLKETIIEIIKNVSIQRIEKDDYVIKVKGFDYAEVSELLPLIFLDGILIQDHNALLQFNASTIESITVLKHKLVYGPEVFLGVLMINTINGDGYGLLQENSATTVLNIFKPQNNKNYFVQKYDSLNAKSRIPDDRLQLVWLPKLKIEANTKELVFYTSDVTGEFEIRIEGFTENHQPVSIRKSFYVK